MKGPSSKGDNRVIRGGSWNNNSENCRSTNRNNNPPEIRNNNLGFRLVISPSSQEGRIAASEQMRVLFGLRLDKYGDSFAKKQQDQ